MVDPNSSFKCPVCASPYFGPIYKNGEHVGRYCKGWPSTEDRSYKECRVKHEEFFDNKSRAAGEKENK